MAYEYKHPEATAKQAAEHFAAIVCDDRRKVGTVIAAPDAALKFQLVGGVRWYAVRCLPDYSGWEISTEA